MLLLDIRDYVQLMGSVTLTDLARRFNVAESAMQGMMETWIRKGQVIMSQKEVACSVTTCGGCSQAGCDMLYIKYSWQDR